MATGGYGDICERSPRTSSTRPKSSGQSSVNVGRMMQSTFGLSRAFPDEIQNLDVKVNIATNQTNESKSHESLKTHLKETLVMLATKWNTPQAHDKYYLSVVTEYPQPKATPPIELNLPLLEHLRCDIAIFLNVDIPRDNCVPTVYGPIVVGEVTSQLVTDEDISKAYEQLLSYHLFINKPICKEQHLHGSRRRLIGFITDEDNFIIHELHISDWLSFPLVSQATHFRYYNRNHDNLFHAKCCQLILNRITNGMERQANGEYKALNLRTFEFPFESATTLRHANVVYLELREFCQARDSFQLFQHYQNNEAIELLPNDYRVVLKATGLLFMPGEECNRDALVRHLNSDQDNIFVQELKELYLGVYSSNDDDDLLTFTLMRCYGDKNNPQRSSTDAQKSDICAKWPEENGSTRRSFLTNVYQVAIEALVHGWFHWDIRPPNVLFYREENGAFRFRIIDWESGFEVPASNQKVLNIYSTHKLQSPTDVLSLAIYREQRRSVMAGALVEQFYLQFIRIWHPTPVPQRGEVVQFIKDAVIGSNQLPLAMANARGKLEDVMKRLLQLP